jgi:hypothetical protein
MKTHMPKNQFKVEYINLYGHKTIRSVSADNSRDAMNWVQDQPDCAGVLCCWRAGTDEQIKPEPLWWTLLIWCCIVLLLTFLIFTTLYLCDRYEEEHEVRQTITR